MYLMTEYFSLWHNNVQLQITQREEALQLMEQQRSNFKVKSSFQTWRRLFRATIVARYIQVLRINLLRVADFHSFGILVNLWIQIFNQNQNSIHNLHADAQNESRNSKLMNKQNLKKKLFTGIHVEVHSSDTCLWKSFF